jgi:TAFII55 protein conserved region
MKNKKIVNLAITTAWLVIIDNYIIYGLNIFIVLDVEDGRNGTFIIGNESFPASLLDLPCIVESYKTYEESLLIKTADVGQVRKHSYLCNSCYIFRDLLLMLIFFCGR